MTLDTIDRAFVARWQARRVTPRTRHDVAPSEPVITVADENATPAPSADVLPAALPDPEPIVPAPAEESLVERLLSSGQEQWKSLADEIEVARLDGHRVIAIVGGEPHEGRSTLVECLTHTLRDRGRDVVVLASAEDATDLGGAPPDGGQLHDRRIILVDAGIWFPPGPIRRHRLITESVGCDAAILVRRADREPVAARATALAALGMTVLGEVVTFASPDGDDS